MAFQKTQAQIQYMKTNENIPGGTGPIYYSQTYSVSFIKVNIRLKRMGLKAS